MPNTQGMGESGKGLSFAKPASEVSIPAPLQSKLSVFTDLEKQELKQMMREVLEEYGLKPIDQL